MFHISFLTVNKRNQTYIQQELEKYGHHYKIILCCKLNSQKHALIGCIQKQNSVCENEVQLRNFRFEKLPLFVCKKDDRFL
jgi:hypothetical protein